MYIGWDLTTSYICRDWSAFFNSLASDWTYQIYQILTSRIYQIISFVGLLLYRGFY